ncbi:MAG: carboxymuconolactone decarboxylase family protein [Vicinamibacterales bacterium]
MPRSPDPSQAHLSPKMRALLALAARVQQSGRAVTPDVVAAARAEGATDMEIHDTVLIAAAFCMFNRYVDGLGATTPADPEMYRARAAMTAAHGYSLATPTA